jgi:hypothetical protein
MYLLPRSAESAYEDNAAPLKETGAFLRSREPALYVGNIGA